MKKGKHIAVKNVTKKFNSKQVRKITISKANLFILISLVFIVGCFIFYGSRLIHYYRIENPKIKENETIFKMITLKKNIVKIGEGLYKEEANYIYKGKEVNNYVKYSGRIWRILSVEDNKVKMITEKPQTSLVWGIKTTYDNSLVRSWLNNGDNDIKSFYESLNNTDIIVNTKTCTDIIVQENISCDEIIEEKVGLLSAYEYYRAGGENSYLNIGEYWWTSSINENNLAWYIYSKGTLNNTVSTGKTYYAYGVRPTITIDGNTKVISGDGSKENPYNFDFTTNNLLNNKYVGDYISYSGYNWRIIESDDNYVKIVMDGVIKKDEEDLYTIYGSSNYMDAKTGLGWYLNNEFYETLEKKEYILNFPYNMGRYDKTYNYDFNKITEYKENMNVGLLQLGELFVTDVDQYFLSTRTITSDGTIYEVLKEGKIYAGSIKDEQRVRPTLYLKPNLIAISGNGSINDPYMIG